MTAEVEDDRPTGDRRDDWRREIAGVLEVDPAVLGDGVHLDDLGLDSLARMSLLAWLDGKGVSTVEPGALRCVGDVLALLDRLPTGDGITVVIRAMPGGGDSPLPRVGGPTQLPPAGPPRRSPLTPVLANHAFRLTPIEQRDLDFLYTVATHPETGYRWRYRGAPPPPDRFAAELWAQVLVQYVARTVSSGEAAGLVVAYAADPAQGHAYLGAAFLPEHTGTGLAAEATALFARYLFHTFPLRKLYLEVPGFNWPDVRSGAGRLFQVEGVLHDHDFYAGRYWDKYLCAIYPPCATGPSSCPSVDPNLER